MKREIQTVELRENIFKMISKDWFLITAGDADHYNTMTASWGGVGFLWNKPVAFVFIRPERYTHEIVEARDSMTLSFLGDKYRDALKHLGSTSGRDGDKIAATGLTPYFTEGGNPAFTEAYAVIEGRKLYKTPMQPEAFLDPELLQLWYGKKGGLHDVYVIEIEKLWVEEGLL